MTTYFRTFGLKHKTGAQSSKCKAPVFQFYGKNLLQETTQVTFLPSGPALHEVDVAEK